MKIILETSSVVKQATSLDSSYAPAGFKNLKSLEVCGGFITDAGVKNIKDLKALTQLNLSQNVNLTDKTLELISGTALTYGNKFCAFNSTQSLACIYVPRPRSLDANKSHGRPCATGLTALVNLNVSNSRVSNAGLKHLKDLQNLRSLSLDSTRVTANEMKKLLATTLPNLISMRPE